MKASMNAATVTGPGKAEVLEADRPQAGPDDVLVRMRACGICGSDAFYITIGGIPPRQGHTPLGHEPAGEVVEVGANVPGIAVGDHVVINPMAAPSGIISWSYMWKKRSSPTRSRARSGRSTW